MTISDQAKERVAAVLLPGDAAVDATMGNGWDLLFLAEQVGADGRVFGFDVQSEALAATRKRLQKAEVLERCELHQMGHENMGEVVPVGVGAVMFNLGYLPYAGREVVTLRETTLQALGTAVRLLKRGGILTVICYRGHPGGAEEAEAVWAWFQTQKENAQVTGPISFPENFPEGEGPFLLTLTKS